MSYSDAKLTALLQRLDELAREYDITRRDYRLPVHDGKWMEHARGVVRAELQS